MPSRDTGPPAALSDGPSPPHGGAVGRTLQGYAHGGAPDFFSLDMGAGWRDNGGWGKKSRKMRRMRMGRLGRKKMTKKKMTKTPPPTKKRSS